MKLFDHIFYETMKDWRVWIWYPVFMGACLLSAVLVLIEDIFRAFKNFMDIFKK